jgi:hypothetical protein
MATCVIMAWPIKKHAAEQLADRYPYSMSTVLVFMAIGWWIYEYRCDAGVS